MNDSKPQHPSFAELIALSIGELAPVRADEVREHLLDCPACLAQMRTLLRLPDAAPPSGREITEEEQATDWQRLQARITDDERAIASTGSPPAKTVTERPFSVVPNAGAASDRSSRPARFWQGKAAAMLLAAGFGALAVGGFWLAARDRAMQPAVWSTLKSEESYVRSGEGSEPRTLKCPADGNPFGLQFALGSGETPGIVFVRIAAASGKVIHGYEAAEPDDRGIAGVTVRRNALPDGSYVLLAQRETRNAPIERFPFLVKCRP